MSRVRRVAGYLFMSAISHDRSTEIFIYHVCVACQGLSRYIPFLCFYDVQMKFVEDDISTLLIRVTIQIVYQ